MPPPPSTPSLDALRRHAVAHTLFTPTTLPQALQRLGFVQADPIRAPARAQDLTLRHRVKGYRAGELERRYPRLAVEEDFFINYGFMPRELQALMHPREPETRWSAARRRQAEAVLAFVRERGVVHPREVDAAFAHGKATNWFGGTSNASTQLLDGMHYRGLVRTAAREGGIRLYGPREPHAPAEDVDAAIDRLVDVLLANYAPLPGPSLSMLVSRIRYGAPQWTAPVRAAVKRARERLPSAEVDGVRWFWREGQGPGEGRARARHAGVDDDATLRLLAPFDPIVWDRRRFELLWGWAYRFEAYTPAPKRVRGYYALPLLWRGRVPGWANAQVVDGRLQVQPGYVSGRAPRDAGFAAALRDEAERLATFLGADDAVVLKPA